LYNLLLLADNLALQTAATIKGFILAMLLFPEVQRKAQQEIDRVIGSDRLPILSDRDNLPYIEALLMEAHRWHTVAPMALNQMADEDIIYRGFLIPKGAALMANSWYVFGLQTISAFPSSSITRLSLSSFFFGIFQLTTLGSLTMILKYTQSRRYFRWRDTLPRMAMDPSQTPERSVLDLGAGSVLVNSLRTQLFL
jgi:hypothetical protein